MNRYEYELKWSSGKTCPDGCFSKATLVNNPFFKKKRCDTRHKIVAKISRFHHIPLFLQVKHLANENHHFGRILYPFRAEFRGMNFWNNWALRLTARPVSVTRSVSSSCSSGLWKVSLDWIGSRIDGFNDGEKLWKWNLVIDWNFAVPIGCNFHAVHVRPIRGKRNLARLL